MVLAAVIVVATLAAMTSGKVPPVLALGCGLAVAGLTKVAPPEELFAGLSNGGVITVAAMLVVAKGVVRTGIVSRMTWRLLATVTTAQQALRRLVVPVGTASALVNTTPIVAMLIPATKELEQSREVPSRQVLLPIAHVTTLVGPITLIGTSSNLLIAGIAATYGVQVSMFSFTLVVAPIAIVGTAVVYLLAPWLLRADAAAGVVARDWRVELPVARSAIVVGRTAAELGVARTQVFELTSVQRWGEPLDPDVTIEGGDVLVYAATQDGVTALWGSPAFGLSPQRLYQVSVGAEEVGTLRDLEREGDLRVIAAMTAQGLAETPVEPGGTCFVTGATPESLDNNRALSLWRDAAGRVPQPRKTWVALLILAAVIVSGVFGLAPVVVVAFTGALLMVITRVLTAGAAARALDWETLFILAGSVGLGNVVVSSGLATELSDAIITLSGGQAALVVIVLVITTALLTNVVSNAAAASILTPVTLGLAAQVGADPVVMLTLLGACISFTFLSPFAHQTNLMVLKPGGYSTWTFVRFGVPVFLASVVAACLTGYLLIR